MSELDTYEVRPGDTLSKIGAFVNIEWPLIAQLNGIKKPYTILVGQSLLLPRVSGLGIIAVKPGDSVQDAIWEAEVPDSAGRHGSVVFSPGVFECAELEWNTHPSLIGSNMGETILRFDGVAGGHILGMTDPGPGAIAWTQIKNLSFDGAGLAKNCILNAGAVGYDIGCDQFRCVSSPGHIAGTAKE